MKGVHLHVKPALSAI